MHWKRGCLKRKPNYDRRMIACKGSESFTSFRTERLQKLRGNITRTSTTFVISVFGWKVQKDLSLLTLQLWSFVCILLFGCLAFYGPNYLGSVRDESWYPHIGFVWVLPSQCCWLCFFSKMFIFTSIRVCWSLHSLNLVRIHCSFFFEVSRSPVLNSIF